MNPNSEFILVPRAAWPHIAKLPRAAVLLYLELCSRVANPDAPAVRSSVPTLARAIAISERAAYEALDAVQQTGRISRTKTGGTQPNEIVLLDFCAHAPAEIIEAVAPILTTERQLTPEPQTIPESQVIPEPQIIPPAPVTPVVGETHEPPAVIAARESMDRETLGQFITRHYRKLADLGPLVQLADANELQLRAAIVSAITSYRLSSGTPPQYFFDAVKQEFPRIHPLPRTCFPRTHMLARVDERSAPQSTPDSQRSSESTRLCDMASPVANHTLTNLVRPSACLSTTRTSSEDRRSAEPPISPSLL